LVDKVGYEKASEKFEGLGKPEAVGCFELLKNLR
jgi:hypothetical protein